MQKCRLGESFCPGGRDAEVKVKWTIMADIDGAQTSYLCRKCFEGRPNIINVLSVYNIEKEIENEG